MEKRVTLGILGSALVLVGLAWFIFSQAALLKQMELKKLQALRDIERAKTDSREKTITQEKAKFHQLAQKLEKERRLRSNTEQQLDKERRLHEEDSGRLKQLQAHLENLWDHLAEADDRNKMIEQERQKSLEALRQLEKERSLLSEAERKQKDDSARRRDLEAELEAFKARALEAKNRLIEERRKYARPLEDARLKDRISRREEHPRNLPPPYGRAGAREYMARRAIPRSIDIARISADLGRRAAAVRRRMVFRDGRANLLLVADPFPCGPMCVRVQVTIFRNGILLGRRMMVFGNQPSPYEVIRMLRNSRSYQ